MSGGAFFGGFGLMVGLKRLNKMAMPGRALRYAMALTLAIASGAWPAGTRADTVYQTPEAFIAEAFGTPPRPSYLWLTADLQAGITPLLGHPYGQARLRYWHAGNTTAWILEEIGKEYPITAGFVVRDGHIATTHILVYRESRGSEVHLPDFLNQFAGAALDSSGALTRHIDGITGATLSVSALQRMARTALYLTSRLP